MKLLDKDWLTKGLIDFEYKKYILLSYFKNARENFNQGKIYPFLGDLLFHYQNIVLIKENKDILQKNFPKKINKTDFEQLKLVYQKVIEDNELIHEIENILAFAIPHFKTTILKGKEVYEYVEKNVIFTPIGVVPLYNQEGYLLLEQQFRNNDIKVYQYQVTVFESSNEKYRGVHVKLLDSIKKGIGKTFEHIKLEVIKKYKELPNPATYLFTTSLKLPLQHTLLPVAKRFLAKNVEII